jgi:hypothetical protein
VNTESVWHSEIATTLFLCVTLLSVELHSVITKFHNFGIHVHFIVLVLVEEVWPC